MTKTKIALLYERLSRDDEKSKGRKAKLFFSASIRDAVFLLLDSPDKFVVDSNALDRIDTTPRKQGVKDHEQGGRFYE